MSEKLIQHRTTRNSASRLARAKRAAESNLRTASGWALGCVLAGFAVVAAAQSNPWPPITLPPQGPLPVCPDPGVCFTNEAAKDAWARAHSCQFPAEARVQTGLGADIDALVALSPTLESSIEQLLLDGWVFVYGTPGAGDYTSLDGSKIIRIDGNYRNDANATLSGLAHEVGHATFTVDVDTSSKDAYVSAYLEGEGAAVLMNIKVQREIIANGGPDIGMRGKRENHAFYNSQYDQFLQDNDAERARHAIGDYYGAHELTSVEVDDRAVTYEEYYGDYYEEHYGSP